MRTTACPRHPCPQVRLSSQVPCRASLGTLGYLPCSYPRVLPLKMLSIPGLILRFFRLLQIRSCRKTFRRSNCRLPLTPCHNVGSGHQTLKHLLPIFFHQNFFSCLRNLI